MACRHEGYHCSKVSFPGSYAVTRAVTPGAPVPRGKMIRGAEFIRWSTPEDPPFPCLCRCDECENWRRLREQIDGPVVLPVELPVARLLGHG